MNQDDKYLISLIFANAKFLSLKEKIVIVNNLDSINEVALMSVKDISKIINRTIVSKTWNAQQSIEKAKRRFLTLKYFKIGYTEYGDSNYPVMLSEISDPPYMLFYRGDLEVLKNPCISVVGSRTICNDTALAAFNFAKDAATDDCCIVSGLTAGIDVFAHKGVLKMSPRGATVAVLPSGIDTIVPSANKIIAAAILKNGCVISEYEPGVPPLGWRFTQRNRIIAGLSAATVVIQAPPGSGSLSTAEFAVEYNRDLAFHAAAFCDDAKAISKQKLIALSSKNKKNFATAESYIAAGAGIIKDYSDFKAWRLAAPGSRI
ncbi:MAG: DNA-protecting protein DprA [Treponema sp.]|nr:DNA-protecting protein DprA [Treponema sp.]